MILHQKGSGDERQETGTDREENRKDQGGALEDRPDAAWFPDVPIQGPQREKRCLLADQLHSRNEKLPFDSGRQAVLRLLSNFE